MNPFFLLSNRKTVFLACLLVSISLCGFSQDSKTSADAASAKDKQAFRQHYIDQFKRIGLNSTPGDARMLRILIYAANCKRGIEVGTATGYGAIVMGEAFEHNGGELTTIDIDPRMVKTAREHIANMGLEDTVNVVEGDALKVLPALKGEFDFIYIDALKQDYFKYFKAVEDKLKPGSVIVADNVIKFENQMKDFLSYMQESPNYDIQIIQCSQEKGDGMAVIYKMQ